MLAGKALTCGYVGARSERLEPQPSDPLIYTATLMASKVGVDLANCCSAVRSSCRCLASRKAKTRPAGSISSSHGLPGLAGGDRVQAPLARHAFQFRQAAVVEADPGPGDQVFDRLRHQHL